jgi:RES domain-containing protein
MPTPRPFPLALLDALEECEVSDWHTTAWRHVFEGTRPLRPNERGARWNPPGTEALYCSLDADTAIAEIDHLIALQPVPITKQRITYELDITIDKVIDLSTTEALRSVGLSMSDLIADAYGECATVGAAAAWLGYSAMIVPSARGEANNLVVFATNLDPDDSIEIVKEERFDRN